MHEPTKAHHNLLLFANMSLAVLTGNPDMECPLDISVIFLYLKVKQVRVYLWLQESPPKSQARGTTWMARLSVTFSSFYCGPQCVLPNTMLPTWSTVHRFEFCSFSQSWLKGRKEGKRGARITGMHGICWHCGRGAARTPRGKEPSCRGEARVLTRKVAPFSGILRWEQQTQ